MPERIDLVITLIRNFFIQSVFNFERYQNIGFLFSISYMIKKYIKDKEELKKIFLRHLDVFNTQPYMSGFVVGNIIRMELDRKSDKDIITIKQSLACTYASIGDRIFWSRLRVIELYITVILGIIFYYGTSGYMQKCCMWIAVVIPTLFYFIYTLYIRYIGIRHGFLCGGLKSCGLDLFNWNKMIKTLSRIAFFLTVVCYTVVLFLYGFSIININSFKSLLYVSIPFISFAVQRFFRRDKKNILYPVGVMFVISFFIYILMD